MFKILPLNLRLLKALNDKINHKTKPIGALGVLEEIAKKIGLIQNTLDPKIKKPLMMLFAGDHGIAESGLVNSYPQEVTAQMVLNFLNGGAAINVFCRSNGLNLKVVDAGVKYDFEKHPCLIQCKMKWGTKNYLKEPSMSQQECLQTIEEGSKLVLEAYQEGSNFIGFGEMGIGNTSSASLIMNALTDFSMDDCVGNGTASDDTMRESKLKILNEVQKKYEKLSDPLEVLATLGGFEMAMMYGALLKAAELGMTVLIDGFIVSSVLLVAFKKYPSVLDYCLFAHISQEKGHKLLLDLLGVKPLLSLGMRLGEGTGAAIAYPIIQSAVDFLNQMASFETASVSQKK